MSEQAVEAETLFLGGDERAARALVEQNEQEQEVEACAVT